MTTPTPNPQPPAPPEPTSLLAIAGYLYGALTEGQLAGELGVDRLEALARVSEFLNTSITNAGAFIEHIGILETRLATALSQLLAEQVKTHDLRNQIQILTLQTEDLQLQLDAARRDLVTERRHLAELAREQGSGSPEGSTPMD